MSFLKPTLRQQKERLQHKIDILKHKIKHTVKKDQRTALEFKLNDLVNEKNTLWKNYVLGGRK